MYKVELFEIRDTSEQDFIADITHLVEGLDIDFKLNTTEDLSFSLNADAWVYYCRKAGIDPRSSIEPLNSEIKIKYNDVYLPAVFEIQTAEISGDVDNRKISIKARGVLIKLDYRVTFDVYNNRPAGNIVRNLISMTQAKQYGDFGITLAGGYHPATPTSRTFKGETIMKAITDLADDESGGFDFWFDEDKKLHFAEKRGSDKSHIRLTYGGDLSNILSFTNPNDGNGVRNSVFIHKEVDGAVKVSKPNTDGESARRFGLRELALSGDDKATDEHNERQSRTEVSLRKNLEDTPKVRVSDMFINPNTVFVGDIITLEMVNPMGGWKGKSRVVGYKVSLDDAWHASYDLTLKKI